MKQLLVIYVIGLIGFSSCHSPSKLQVDHVEEVDYGFPAGCKKDSCNEYYHIYLVQDYKDGLSDKLVQLMDSIACDLNKGGVGFELFGIYVIRYSSVSNIANWMKFPKDVYRSSLSNDLVLSYHWRKGVLTDKSMYKRRSFFRPNELIETELSLDLCR
ncbi:MAG: hypothetical protein R2787_13575 [Saprospiraceae bacterium]